MKLDAPLVSSPVVTTIRNSAFTNNLTHTSTAGSALSIYSITPILIESTNFSENKNSAFGSKGAAIYTHANTQATLTLVSCEFKYNEAVLGAAIYFQGSSLEVQSSIISDNGVQSDTEDVM